MTELNRASVSQVDRPDMRAFSGLLSDGREVGFFWDEHSDPSNPGWVFRVIGGEDVPFDADQDADLEELLDEAEGCLRWICQAEG